MNLLTKKKKVKEQILNDIVDAIEELRLELAQYKLVNKQEKNFKTTT